MKKGIIITIMDLVFLAAFNIIFFIAGGTEHTQSEWIAYAFIHFSYVMLLLTPLLTRRSSSAYIFGASISTVSYVYFIITFIIDLILIFVKSDSYLPAVIINVIITAIYILMLMSVLLANEHTADSVEKHEDELKYVKNASTKLRLILSSIDDKVTEKEVQKAYDIIHSSPVASNYSVKGIESEILGLVDILYDNVSGNQNDRAVKTADRIIKLANVRNMQLKIR